MATVTGLTAARMLAIEAASVVDGDVIGGNLILTKHDASTINAGSVIGPTGPTGPVATITGLFSARPAASAGLNGQIFFATDKMMAWMCISAAWVLVWVYAPEVAVLPTSPIDQQECIFVADATNGVKWHLKYRAASSQASKWECIGGMPLHAMNVVSDGTSSTTYVLPGTPVSLTTPLTGYYECESRAGLYSNTAGNYIVSDFHIAGIATGVSIVRHTPSAVWANSTLEPRAAKWRFSLTAGQTLDQRVAVLGGSGNIGLKYLSMMPIRVG